MKLKPSLLLLPFALLILSFVKVPQIDIYGALKNFMHHGDVSAKFDLSELNNTENYYGIGALENLKGEIMIINSKPFISKQNGDNLQVNNSFKYKAALFVGTSVKEWDNEGIPTRIKTQQDLQNFIEEQASNRGINTEEAFPFMITGMFKQISWHVINWKDGDIEHTHEKHVTSGVHGTKKDATGRILGFYSPKHHRIFTHHSTNMHMHIKMDEPQIAAHVDEIELDGKGLLFLPKDFISN
jgi:alpha-acetolactate decarboxylase